MVYLVLVGGGNSSWTMINSEILNGVIVRMVLSKWGGVVEVESKLGDLFVILSMNRLILIGNGFDLAHQLKTDYNSFILWYLNECFNKKHNVGEYVDELIHLPKTEHPFGLYRLPEINTIAEFIDHYYKDGFSKLLRDELSFKGWQNIYVNPFQLVFKSNLIRTLILNCNYKNWVDIENEFYEQLKVCYNDNVPDIEKINELNNSLKFIILQLEIYLSSINCKKFSSQYSDILNSMIQKKEIVDLRLEGDKMPDFTLILNFNYTNTIEAYTKQKEDLPLSLISAELNYIHGEINNDENPLIFGFGDELDDDYEKMELTKANGFFEYIKSFWYFKTSNYHNLIRFIESHDYQVYILGHSCGLSDRTLLSMIFEHQYCKSIKIYYYGDKQKNNYTHLTQEISRHFRNKVALRNKIVPFDKSLPMPQAE